MSYADRAAATDSATGYEAVRQELITLVRGLGAADLARTVPASPAWSVRDVLAHVTGITEDLNAMAFGAGSPDEWTMAQVERHRAEPLEETIAAWDREAPAFERGLVELGYEFGSHFIGDLFIHLTDVRVALDRPVDRDEPSVWISLDFYLDALGEELADAHVGAIAVETGTETRVVGPGDVAASVSADAFEILRACAGRRTLDAIGAYSWSGDSDAFIDRLSRYPVPAADVGP